MAEHGCINLELKREPTWINNKHETLCCDGRKRIPVTWLSNQFCTAYRPLRLGIRILTKLESTYGILQKHIIFKWWRHTQIVKCFMICFACFCRLSWHHWYLKSVRHCRTCVRVLCCAEPTISTAPAVHVNFVLELCTSKIQKYKAFEKSLLGQV